MIKIVCEQKSTSLKYKLKGQLYSCLFLLLKPIKAFL